MSSTVILISVDTLRSDVVQSNPFKEWPGKFQLSTQPRSTALERFSREGCFFYNCISAAPYTSASHATYFTGKWPLRHGLFELYNRKLKSRTLFDLARRQGYRTVFKTDFPITLGRELGFLEGADEHFVEDEAAFLAALTKPGPVFAFCHFSGLHVPYGFHNLKFGGDAYRRKVEELCRLVGPLPDTPKDELVLSRLGEEDHELLMKYNRVVQHLYETRRYAELFRLYLEGAQRFFETRLDTFMENLLESVDPQSTLVCLFGDHGEDYDEGTFGHFNSVNDAVLRVPLFFWGNGVQPGIHGGRIRSVDLAPTLIEMLGFDASGGDIDGASLAATVRAGAPYESRRAFAQAYVPGIKEYARFQKRMLETGRKSGWLRHDLSREVIYDGPFRLIREHRRYADCGTEATAVHDAPRLERMGSDHRWQSLCNVDVEQHLRAVLDAYNSLRQAGADWMHVPEGVRRQLVAMGYRV